MKGGPFRFNMESVQDNPPPGGYPKLNFSRGIKPRGPSGAMIWGGVLFLSTYGFIMMGYTNERKRDIAKEKRNSRMAILPYFITEQDAYNEMKTAEALARESAIMKNVEDWEVGKSSYSTRWTRPTGGR